MKFNIDEDEFVLISEWQNLSHLMKARYSDYTNDQLLVWAQPRGSHVTKRKQMIDVLDKFTLQGPLARFQVQF